MMTGVADDQATHTVTNQGKLGDRNRVRGNQGIQQRCQLPPVLRQRQPRVVPHVEGSIAELTLEQIPIGRGGRRLCRIREHPEPFVTAEPMHQDTDTRRWLRVSAPDLCRCQRQRTILMVEGHVDGQFVFLFVEIVAERPVDQTHRPGDPRRCCRYCLFCVGQGGVSITAVLVIFQACRLCHYLPTSANREYGSLVVEKRQRWSHLLWYNILVPINSATNLSTRLTQAPRSTRLGMWRHYLEESMYDAEW